MSGLLNARQPVIVRPNAWPGITQVVFRTPQKPADIAFLRTVLEQIPGYQSVESTDPRTFRVTLSDAAEAQVAAQCFIERAFGIPHLFSCRWYEERPEFTGEQGINRNGMVFLEPVAESLASTLMARFKQLSIGCELLFVTRYRLIFRLTVNLPVVHTYETMLLGTGIQSYGVGKWDEREWSPGLPPERLAELMKWH